MTGSQKKFYGTLAALALAGVVFIGYQVTQGESGGVTESPDMTVAFDPDQLVGPEIGVAAGPEDAPVTVEEYVDYQCPACGMVARLTVPGVFERYVETGRIRYILFDFPVLGEKSFLAAEAARCAGDQDSFWPMHDVLFARVGEWRRENDPTGKFEDYAGMLGLDERTFEQCLDSRKHRQTVLASRRRGEQLGINSTPTFLVNERRHAGMIGFDRLAAIIEEEMAGE